MLDVPVMTLYTVSAPQHTNLQTNLSFQVSSRFAGPSTTFYMRWANVSGVQGPVLFNLIPSGVPYAGTAFRADGVDGFQALPAGDVGELSASAGWSLGLGGSGIQQVDCEHWLMNYTVLQMAQTQASAESRWTQVNYTLAYWGSVGNNLPACNVTAPAAADLAPVGGRGLFNLSRGSTLGVLLSTNDPSILSMTFRHTLPPIVLHAGSLGNLSVTLSSEFAWDSSAAYWLGWSVTAQQAVTLYEEQFVDMRFGSLMVQLSPGA